MEYGANHPCTYMSSSISLRYEHLELTEAMIVISNVNTYHITPAADEANQNRGLRAVFKSRRPFPLCWCGKSHSLT